MRRFGIVALVIMATVAGASPAWGEELSSDLQTRDQQKRAHLAELKTQNDAEVSVRQNYEAAFKHWRATMDESRTGRQRAGWLSLVTGAGCAVAGGVVLGTGDTDEETKIGVLLVGASVAIIGLGIWYLVSLPNPDKYLEELASQPKTAGADVPVFRF